jgi:hypothetical protein
MYSARSWSDRARATPTQTAKAAPPPKVERVGRVESYGAVTLPLALIQQSAWKGNSANFAMTAF